MRFTAEAALAGELLGVAVLDHVVVGRGPGGRVRHASLRELGLFAPLHDGAPAPRGRRSGEGDADADHA